MSDRDKFISHLNDCLEISSPTDSWVFVRKDIVEDILKLFVEYKKYDLKDVLYIVEEELTNMSWHANEDGWESVNRIYEKIRDMEPSESTAQRTSGRERVDSDANRIYTVN